MLFRSGEEFECREAGNPIFCANMSILLIVSVDVGDNTLQKKKSLVTNITKIVRNSLLTSLSGKKVVATRKTK